MRKGIDGFRVDAVPYLYQREGTDCENLPETHSFLKRLRSLVEDEFPGRILLAEANQWPEQLLQYFGSGDEFHMAFHFPIMPRIFISLKKENISSLVWVMNQTPVIPPSCQWCMFLRNHDELTLEMVTEEERQFMWNEYAPEQRARLNLGIRRRLAPLLDNDIRKIKLVHSLLFTLPGAPIIYYGDEIGMGDNIYLKDRDGCRTPMQWEHSAPNGGFTTASTSLIPIIDDPTYGYQRVAVDLQQKSPNSLLNWVRRALRKRKEWIVLARGLFEILPASHPSVFAYIRIMPENPLSLESPASFTPSSPISPWTPLGDPLASPSAFRATKRQQTSSPLLVLHNFSHNVLRNVEVHVPVPGELSVAPKILFKDLWNPAQVVECVPAIPNLPLQFPPSFDIPTPTSRLPPDLVVRYYKFVIPKMGQYSWFWFEISLPFKIRSGVKPI